jgi:WD40 repeat-containing protein SMU1
MSAPALQVESADVIRLIQQFLLDHQLHASLAALQTESQVTLNTVDSIDKFTADITAGKWESVLTATQRLTLPGDLAGELYSQIALELAEAKEFEAARGILRSEPMAHRKRDAPERYLHVEHAIARAAASGALDTHVAYGPSGKDAKRKELAAALAECVQVVPPARLLSLLTQSLKYQQLQGLLPKGQRYDLLRGSAPVESVQSAIESYPTKNSRVVKFATKSYPEVARFAPDGLVLASGSCDGYIELWDAQTGKLQLEYAYQAEDQLMSHDSAVLCLAFSLSMELLASASAKGDVKVWRLETGSCVRKFATAHSEGVTQIDFMRDGSSVLTSSFDGLLRLHGLKSGRTLKEFRGHSSFVTGFAVADEIAATATTPAAGERLLSTSADGTIRVWDLKTADCLRVIRFSTGSGGPAPSLLGIQSLHLGGVERFVIVERSGLLRIIDADGAVLQTFQSTSTSSAAAPSLAELKAAAPTAGRKKATSGEQPTQASDFVCATVSPKGKYLYAVTEECVLHCFEIGSIGGGKLVHAIKLHKADTLGVTHHPHKSILASYSLDGSIKLWTP